MIILLDMCVPRRYQRLLQSWNYTAELSSTHLAPNASDSEVIALAKELGAVLLTEDLDFANILDYPPSEYSGIIVLRYKIEDEAALDTTLKTALSDLEAEGLMGKLVIIAPNRYRVRQ